MMSSFKASASRPSEASLVVEVDESGCELLWFADVVDVPVGCKLCPYDAPEVLPVLFDVDDGA
ncbi:hypothetical protein XB05_01315 [Xanthomonas arboricola]|nr:hypothetical protein XB05_01315 [Xanthomonas arboricola]